MCANLNKKLIIFPDSHVTGLLISLRTLWFISDGDERLEPLRFYGKIKTILKEKAESGRSGKKKKESETVQQLPGGVKPADLVGRSSWTSQLEPDYKLEAE